MRTWRLKRIGGLTFTEEDFGLRPLMPGTEALFFLKRVGDRYHIGGTHYGAMQVVNGRIVPLAERADVAQEYRDRPATDVTNDINTRVLTLRKSSSASSVPLCLGVVRDRQLK